MSIVSVNLLRQKRATGTPEGLSYIRQYRVLTDSTGTTEKEILADGNLPVFYEALVDDDTVVCKERNAEQNLDNLFEWIVDCRYGTRSGDEPDPGTSLTKPTDEPPQITFGFVRKTIAIDKSYKSDGSDTKSAQSIPVRNSAGDEFDPPVVEEKINLLLTIVRNELTANFSPKEAYEFIDTVNKIKILIAGVNFAPWCALMREMHAVKLWDSEGVAYYQTTYQIEGDPDTHVKKVLDQGYYYLAGEEGEKKSEQIRLSTINSVMYGAGAPKAKEDAPVTEPQKLDLEGGIFTPTEEEKAKYISFHTKFQKEWSTLDLPTKF